MYRNYFGLVPPLVHKGTVHPLKEIIIQKFRVIHLTLTCCFNSANLSSVIAVVYVQNSSMISTSSLGDKCFLQWSTSAQHFTSPDQSHPVITAEIFKVKKEKRHLQPCSGFVAHLGFEIFLSIINNTLYCKHRFFFQLNLVIFFPAKNFFLCVLRHLRETEMCLYT